MIVNRKRMRDERELRASAKAAKSDAFETWREAYEERAAILEYDANLSPEEAERRALEFVGLPPRPAPHGSQA